MRQGLVFGLGKGSLGGALQKRQFTAKERGAFRRQEVCKVLQHGAEAAGHLDARAAKLTDFRDRQIDEILPIGRPIDQPQRAGRVVGQPFVQAPPAHTAQEVMDLVNRQDRGGRIVDGRGERLGGDIDHNPEGKSRVLLHGPFLAQSN